MTRKKFLKRAGFPLYMQVKEYLQGKIESSDWLEGFVLPKEEELCSELGVSRITLREAMKMLVKDGRLRRVPGKGTFVTEQKLDQNLNKFFSFTRWATENGFRPASRILRVQSMESPSHIAVHLGIMAGDKVTYVERVRLGNDEPLMAEEIWIAAALCPSMHLKDLANISLNEILAKEYGISLAGAMESIETTVADKHVKELLNMQDPALLLSVEHTAYMADMCTAYFVVMKYRGDRVKFSIKLGNYDGELLGSVPYRKSAETSG